MQKARSRFQNYISLFLPSPLSIFFGIFLSGLTIVLNQSAILKTQLQLPQNMHFGRMIAGWVDHLLSSTINESRTATLVVGLFWALVGLAVYAFLRSLARFIMELDDNLAVRHYVWPKGTDRYRPLRVLAEQAVFRLCAIILMIIVLLWPLARILRGPILVDFLGPGRPLQYAVWFLASLLVWHTITILMRLIALRARIFG